MCAWLNEQSRSAFIIMIMDLNCKCRLAQTKTLLSPILNFSYKSDQHSVWLLAQTDQNSVWLMAKTDQNTVWLMAQTDQNLVWLLALTTGPCYAQTRHSGWIRQLGAVIVRYDSSSSFRGLHWFPLTEYSFTIKRSNETSCTEPRPDRG